ncbi:protein MEMO1-like isoform X3 [Pomacea canaliculata]|uniref:protein MEMO1-like isoform X3 n=1 Tax=Pomacea canaliculata TaxID=400727 RepID=UPI000D73EBAD|nr:protein MEMO1-like isoform X3 [Pomacea canaliculata]
MSKVRRATHAGTWYTDVKDDLNGQLEGWLSKAKDSQKPARAIIAPHAGYYYCGACGAHAYRQVDPATIKRVFILGPSHHVRMSGCALSGTEVYQTPLYDLTIDKEIYEKLYATGAFDTMSLGTDEAEHSIEMHLPYIAKVMESRRNQFTIIPILVGSLSPEKEQQYGAILSSYLADPENLFVVSSDFCHWGKRFNYTFYDKSCGKIWQSIEALDKTAIGCLRQNGNGVKMDMKFLKYAQSSQCVSPTDSSVSYAAGALVIH